MYKSETGSQNCFVLIDIDKIGIIVKRRFYSFILRSAIILTQGYHLFLLITKMIIILVSMFSRLIFVQSRNSCARRNLCYPSVLYVDHQYLIAISSTSRPCRDKWRPVSDFMTFSLSRNVYLNII